MKSTQKNFLWAMKWAFIFIILLTVSIFALYHLFSSIWGKDFLLYLINMPVDKDKISALADAGSAIIGYSLAFAGAFTTIILAFLGSRLAFLGHKLALGERVEYLNDKFENFVKEYSNAIAALMHSRIAYNKLINEEPWEIYPETGCKIQLTTTIETTENIRLGHRELIERLMDFVASIERLGMTPLAQAMFHRWVAADDAENKSAILKAQAQYYNFFPYMPQVPLGTTFFEWTALMWTRLYDMKSMEPLELAEERNSFLLPCLDGIRCCEGVCTDEENCIATEHEADNILAQYEAKYEQVCANAKKYIPRYEQDILGLGYYLDFRVRKEDSSDIIQRYFVHSGSAFICDLIMMYPSNDAFKNILKDMFPSHSDCDDIMKLDFSNENVLPLGFMESVRNMKTFAQSYVQSISGAGTNPKGLAFCSFKKT